MANCQKRTRNLMGCTIPGGSKQVGLGQAERRYLNPGMTYRPFYLFHAAIRGDGCMPRIRAAPPSPFILQWLANVHHAGVPSAPQDPRNRKKTKREDLPHACKFFYRATRGYWGTVRRACAHQALPESIFRPLIITILDKFLHQMVKKC